MHIAILILEIIIIILFIYTFRVQWQALRSKKSIIQDYKDIPELAKAKISMREELFKMELDKKIKESEEKAKEKEKAYLHESEEKAKEKEKAYLHESYVLYKTISRLIFIYADFWYFGFIIENMKDVITKKVLLKELHERKKELIEVEKKNPGSKLFREAIMMRLSKEKIRPIDLVLK